MNIMIDIETLGTTPDAVFTQIGWCVFDRTEIKKSGQIYVDPQSCADAGMKFNAATIIWWMERNKIARLEMCKPGIPLASALQKLHFDLKPFMSSSNSVWAKGPSFDLSILDYAYRLCGLSTPWKFWEHRDVRTVLDFYPQEKITETAHTGEEDAVVQAKMMIEAFRQHDAR